MSKSAQEIYDLVKSGKLNPTDLQQKLGVSAAAAAVVTIEDWGVCYSSGTGQLSEFCTVVATNPNNPITGVGMIAYTSDGSSMLAVQYTNDISSTSLMTSIGTTLYNPSSGNQILCVVYGWTTSSNYYFTKQLTIVPC